MSELLGPTFIFDARLAEIVEEIDIERDEVVALLRERHMTDEAIGETVFEFKAGAKENPSSDGEWAEASRRHVTVYLGSYAALALAEESNKRVASVVVTATLSQDLAHEAEHLRQFEVGELPVVWLGELPPHADRPWERQANAVETAYLAALNRRDRGFLGTVDLK